LLYAILCYKDEHTVTCWTKEEDDAVMEKIGVVQTRLEKQRRLGPTARLLPTTSAKTVKKDRQPALVLDGPFAETKEQLLGFYTVECESMEDALAIAEELGEANPGGSYEVRPVGMFVPGTLSA
jgi:hypothetical protein